MSPIRTLLLLVLLAAFAAPAPAAQTVDHRAGGLAFDAFTLDIDGDWHQWSAEDGGRIRYRVNDDPWVFQTVPDQAKDLIRRIHFLADGQYGWAVGRGGTYLWTDDGGSTWQYAQVKSSLDGDPTQSHSGDPVELWDILMFDHRGWMLGAEQIWYTDDVGQNWYAGTIETSVADIHVEYYALDVDLVGNDLVGLACGEPGIVVRAEEPWSTGTLAEWSEVVFDIRDFCPSGFNDLPQCAGIACTSSAIYEPWDIEMAVDGESSLALMVGGIGHQCGVAFSSADTGLTWNRDKHICEQPGSNCSTTSSYLCNSSTSCPCKHCAMKEAYGVGIFRASGRGNAVGYNGQMMVREDGYTSPGTWMDVSQFQGVIANPNAVVSPLFGIDCNDGPGGLERALVTGYGGYLRESYDGGLTYSNTLSATNHPPNQFLPHDPWRLRDVHAVSPQHVWRTGQFARLAFSQDAGFSFAQVLPDPLASNEFLNAFAFRSDNFRAVAVGQLNGAVPHLMFNPAIGTGDWEEGTITSSGTYKELSDVAWRGTVSGDDTFMAVGHEGFILESFDNGENWAIFTPPDFTQNLSAFTIHGVAFVPASSLAGQIGCIVGVRPYTDLSGTEHRGVAYLHHTPSSTLEWEDISPEVGSSFPVVLRITAVATAGSDAWAVGEQLVSGEVRGIILRSVSGARFVEAPNAPVVSRCTVGSDVGDFPVLSCVAVAPGGHVFAGGACGRVWKGVSSGSSWSWQEIKSMTSNHVRNMSFVSDGSGGYVGFLACHRDLESMGHSIIRFRSQ